MYSRILIFLTIDHQLTRSQKVIMCMSIIHFYQSIWHNFKFVLALLLPEELYVRWKYVSQGLWVLEILILYVKSRWCYYISGNEHDKHSILQVSNQIPSCINEDRFGLPNWCGTSRYANWRGNWLTVFFFHSWISSSHVT